MATFKRIKSSEVFMLIFIHLKRTQIKKTLFYHRLTNILDSPEELFAALNLMPNNKAPGPDSYPAELYKHFWFIIAPLFNKMITGIIKILQFPASMNTLLLKPNKDPTPQFSYRPISLLNVDNKIITKALAHRLESYF